MGRTAASYNARTYLPDGGHEEAIRDFVEVLERAGELRGPGPALVDSDGMHHPIPEAMVGVLRQVAEALGSGMGVTVAPLNAMLTTQEAADFLGISRPTLVRILDRGELPMEQPGRHRYVRLSDLLDYQEAVRLARAEALDEMERAGRDAGLYEATDGAPPAMR